MTTYKITPLTSSASSLYEVQILDDDKKILSTFSIASDDSSNLEALATEAYNLLLNPKGV